MSRLPASGRLTGVVPAAAGGGSPPPAAVKLGQSPLGDGVVAQGVRCQVTDLQPGVLPQEVRERHPVEERGDQRSGSAHWWRQRELQAEFYQNSPSSEL